MTSVTRRGTIGGLKKYFSLALLLFFLCFGKSTECLADNFYLQIGNQYFRFVGTPEEWRKLIGHLNNTGYLTGRDPAMLRTITALGPWVTYAISQGVITPVGGLLRFIPLPGGLPAGATVIGRISYTLYRVSQLGALVRWTAWGASAAGQALWPAVRFGSQSLLSFLGTFAGRIFGATAQVLIFPTHLGADSDWGVCTGFLRDELRNAMDLINRYVNVKEPAMRHRCTWTAGHLGHINLTEIQKRDQFRMYWDRAQMLVPIANELAGTSGPGGLLSYRIPNRPCYRSYQSIHQLLVAWYEYYRDTDFECNTRTGELEGVFQFEPPDVP